MHIFSIFPFRVSFSLECSFFGASVNLKLETHSRHWAHNGYRRLESSTATWFASKNCQQNVSFSLISYHFGDLNSFWPVLYIERIKRNLVFGEEQNQTFNSFLLNQCCSFESSEYWSFNNLSWSTSFNMPCYTYFLDLSARSYMQKRSLVNLSVNINVFDFVALQWFVIALYNRILGVQYGVIHAYSF